MSPDATAPISESRRNLPGDGGEPLLRITNLTVRYGQAAALSGLDLTVRRGELFVLLGASGSGKSTLLRAIAGLIAPDGANAGGRIELDGVDLSPLPPHRRPVNTMFQSYALFPHMTVAANIAFGPRQLGLSRAEARALTEEMLALVRLEGLGGRKPHQLSGGQQQRVALARSLAPRPRLLLLDEPLSALDRGLRAETRAELVRVNRQLGIGFIMVTHDQDEALGMADRIGIMDQGRIVQVGTPAEIYEAPASRLIARFMGEANILPGAPTADGTGFVLAGLGLTLRVGATGPGGRSMGTPEDSDARHGWKDARWVAIRAERIRLGGAAPGANRLAAPGANRLAATVVERSYAGDSLAVSVRLADGTVLRVRQALANGMGGVDHPAGAPVMLSWDPDACIPLPE